MGNHAKIWNTKNRKRALKGMNCYMVKSIEGGFGIRFDNRPLEYSIKRSVIQIVVKKTGRNIGPGALQALCCRLRFRVEIATVLQNDLMLPDVSNTARTKAFCVFQLQRSRFQYRFLRLKGIEDTIFCHRIRKKRVVGDSRNCVTYHSYMEPNCRLDNSCGGGARSEGSNGWG